MSFLADLFRMLCFVLRLADLGLQLRLQLVGPLVLGDLAEHQLQAAQLVFRRLRAAIFLFSLLVLRSKIRGHWFNYRSQQATAATRASICSALCTDVRLIRRSDLPSGTLGGRIAGTKRPWRRNSRAAVRVRPGSPRTIGMIWLDDFVRPPNRLRRSAALSRSFSRRSRSDRTISNAASPAAAKGAGVAVEKMYG